jgi:hypothetical protein
MAGRRQSGQYYALSLQTVASPVTWEVVACLKTKSFKSALNVIDATSDCGTDSLGGNITQSFSINGFEDFSDSTIQTGNDLYSLQVAAQNQSSPAYTWKLAAVVPQTGDTILTFNAFISNYQQDYATNDPIGFTADLNIQGTAVLTKV